MKSQVLLLTILLAVSAPMMAHADSAPVSNWDKFTTVVKVTVHKVMAYFSGEKTAASATASVQPAVSVPSTAAAPVSQPQQNVAPAPTTPVAQAIAPVAPQARQVAQVVAPVSQPVAVSKPAPRVNEAAVQMRNQPLFAQKTQGSSLKDVQAAQASVKAANVLKVVKPGRAGTSKLAKSKAGVPTVNWAQLKSVKKVPRLDIGTETLISKEDFTLHSLNWGVQKPSEFKRLPTTQPVSDQAIHKFTSQPIPKVLGARGLQANIRTVGQPLSHEDVEKVQYTINELAQFKELPYKPLAEEQLKMVAALILFEQGNHCHMIMGLFHQLASAEKTKTEANYHLGACAAQLQMHQSAFDNLSKVVVTEDKEFAPDALGIMAKSLLIIYEKDFYKLVKGLKNPKALINDQNRDEVSYRLAKGAYRSGDYKSSIVYAEQVSSSSDLYDDARFLAAMNSFALKDKPGSLSRLQALWASLEQRKISSGNIRALTSVNLARMYFAQKKYDQALVQYMQVPKDHPLWVQALIEQGWTQIALEDYSGAIGNMYSLHSPYFKAVYQPESFVVRTIGYLNICQYGDAYKSMTWLEKDYRDWHDKTSSYLKQKGNAQDIYTTVKNYIRGKSTDDVDGVPFQVWREMAHRKDFLNLQSALNDKQDETKRYEGVNEKIKTEKASIRAHADQSKKRFDQLRAQIAKASTDKGLSKKVDEMKMSLKLEKDLTVGYRFQLAILEQSREGYLDFQNKSQGKLDTETASLNVKAGTTLLTHATRMEKEMSRDLDNNEFLRYEVFAGSGENIRYQVAGGQVSGANRVPASIRPTKMMNWNFDGEFWEDEIGAYRSSLQNNCPINQQARKAESVPTSEQARHVDDDDEN